MVHYGQWLLVSSGGKNKIVADAFSWPTSHFSPSLAFGYRTSTLRWQVAQSPGPSCCSRDFKGLVFEQAPGVAKNASTRGARGFGGCVVK